MDFLILVPLVVCLGGCGGEMVIVGIAKYRGVERCLGRERCKSRGRGRVMVCAVRVEACG